MRVLKFDLEVVDRQEVEMPEGSTVLSVQCQRDRIRIWALCPGTPAIESRVFAVAGTGHHIPDGELVHLGTVQHAASGCVWHVFETHEWVA